MRRLAFAFAMMLGLQSAVAIADDYPVVVELFTSQGCSSCPPADALFKEMDASGDIIGLVWHVDYWDYIGWKDVFAKPDYTGRQKYYAHTMGEKMIYTPQMIFNGSEHAVGSDKARVLQIVAEQRDRAPLVDLEVERNGDVLRISADHLEGSSQKIDVYVIHYIEKSTVEITRGENAGRTSTYTKIVSDWRTVGQWKGRQDLRLDVPLTSELPMVVMLQAEGFGPVLAARQIN